MNNEALKLLQNNTSHLAGCYYWISLLSLFLGIGLSVITEYLVLSGARVKKGIMVGLTCLCVFVSGVFADKMYMALCYPGWFMFRDMGREIFKK